MIKELYSRLQNLVKFGRVTLSNLDTGNIPRAQVVYNEKTKDVMLITPYGFHCIPPKDSLTVQFNVKADEEKQVAIATKPDIRPKLTAEGECVYGNFVIGSIVKFKADGTIEITCKKNEVVTILGDATVNVSGTCNLTAPTTNITGDINITGDVNVTGAVVSNGITLDLHVHTNVTTGVSNTGGPI